MKVSFETDILRDSCCKYDKAQAAFGAHFANVVFNLIADAEAQDTAKEWHEFLVHELVSCKENAFQVAIGTEYIATFVPVGKKYQRDNDGNTDWSTVTRVMLISIQRQE